MMPFQKHSLLFTFINGYLKNDCYSERRCCVSDQQPKCLYLNIDFFYDKLSLRIHITVRS